MAQWPRGLEAGRRCDLKLRDAFQAVQLPATFALLGFREHIERAVGEDGLVVILFSFIVTSFAVPYWLGRREYAKWKREFDAKWRALDAELHAKERAE